MYIDNEYSKLFQIGMNFLFYLSVIDLYLSVELILPLHFDWNHNLRPEIRIAFPSPLYVSTRAANPEKKKNKIKKRTISTLRITVRVAPTPQPVGMYRILKVN